MWEWGEEKVRREDQGLAMVFGWLKGRKRWWRLGEQTKVVEEDEVGGWRGSVDEKVIGRLGEKGKRFLEGKSRR